MRGMKLVAAGALGIGLVAGASAWPSESGGSPAIAQANIATIDVFRCLQAYMLRPEFEQARNEQNTLFATTESEIRERVLANQRKLAIIPPGDPERAMAQQAIEADSQAYNAFRQTATIEAQRLAVSQSTTAFIAVHAGSSALATSLGYTHLIASNLDPSDLMSENTPTSQNTSQMIQELLARPVLMAPAGDDITLRLLESMDLLQYEVDAEADAITPPPVPDPGG